MFQEKIGQAIQGIKQSIAETFKLLRQFKWYIAVYLLFYLRLLMNYLMPCSKNYAIWINEPWYTHEIPIYLALTELMLILFALLFLVGTSNMRNHPWLAKLIFLSSLYFLPSFL